jgi:hypothetical protein
MTDRLFTVALVVALACATTASAQNNDALYELHRKSEAIAGKLFLAGYSKFGNRIRAAAILRACEKAGIANSIQLTAGESSKYLLDQLIQMKTNDQDVAEILNAESSSRAFNLVSGVSHRLAMFEFGYSEAIKVVKDEVPEICAAGMVSADRILKERK